MKFSYVVATLVGAVLSGCAQTSAVVLDPSKSYPPTTNVEILVSPPTRPYVTIAMLEATAPVGTPLPQLIESMRQKAMVVGADAVIPTENASREVIFRMLLSRLTGQQRRMARCRRDHVQRRRRGTRGFVQARPG